VRSWTGIRDMPLGAIGAIDGEQVNVIRTRLMPDIGPAREAVPPGTVLERIGDRLVVQCGDGPLELMEWGPTRTTPA